MISTLLNSAWLVSALPSAFQYHRCLSDPSTRQRELLQATLQQNRNTAFGRLYNFDRIHTVEEFQNTVPLQHYEDLKLWIDRIIAGETNVLCEEPVICLMPSSGSTDAQKLIPYTPSLQKQFSRGINAWISNLFLRNPRLINGRAYWSISPPGFTATNIESKVPIGLADDSEYLGGWKSKLVAKTLAVDASVTRFENIENFRYATLLQLLRCADLRLISVWHPSFLTLLIKALAQHWEALLEDLKQGSMHLPNPHTAASAGFQFDKPQVKRWAQVKSEDPQAVNKIWPALALISCWGDGHAEESARQLQRLVGNIKVEHKGLVATEGFITLPYQCNRRLMHPLAIDSHFFEFIDSDNQIYTADQLKDGGEYEVIITTGGGLYRYRLGDRVLVSGRVKQTPSLRFIGKIDSVSDFYGEKLQDTFVAHCLDRLFQRLHIQPDFSMLAPAGTDAVECYALIVECETDIPASFTLDLDMLLRENPHYAWCRKLGQLGQPTLFLTDNANEAYLNLCVSLGIGLGNIKPAKLFKHRDWLSHFKQKRCH